MFNRWSGTHQLHWFGWQLFLRITSYTCTLRLAEPACVLIMTRDISCCQIHRAVVLCWRMKGTGMLKSICHRGRAVTTPYTLDRQPLPPKSAGSANLYRIYKAFLSSALYAILTGVCNIHRFDTFLYTCSRQRLGLSICHFSLKHPSD